MQVILETERIILREMIPEDIDFLYKIDTDREIMKYYNTPIKKYHEVVERLNNIISAYKQYKGLGIWMAVNKEDSQPLGILALKHIEHNPNNVIEIGYKFDKIYWNKGYAIEAAKAVLEYGFEKMNLDRIVAVANPNNANSIKVMTKLGMEFEKMVYFYNGKLVYYSINAEKYGSDKAL